MIRFSYSNKDIKNKEKKEDLITVWAHKLNAALNIKRVITLNTRCATLNWHTRCSKQIRAN
jgi:hypothetical protein